ncbi:MAG: hypothetical protein HC857_15170 [Synechococcales cyanobacterium RU_4_20]|nr:hypothetical protein [Synechococcales cyanobacterium RU_4_20]NJR71348.1 hypothetical protein [Synechococcales cyanobacterium CRU_2_2]
MTKAKRSERLGVNLTPAEYDQVSDRAQDLHLSISNYARSLLLSPLATDLVQGRSQEQQCQTLEQKLGELYGILNLLSSDLADQLNPPSDSFEPRLNSNGSVASIEPLIRQLDRRLDETLAAMRSMRNLLEQLR